MPVARGFLDRFSRSDPNPERKAAKRKLDQGEKCSHLFWRQTNGPTDCIYGNFRPLYLFILPLRIQESLKKGGNSHGSRKKN